MLGGDRLEEKRDSLDILAVDRISRLSHFMVTFPVTISETISMTIHHRASFGSVRIKDVKRKRSH